MEFLNGRSYLADLSYVREAMKMPLLDRETEMELARAWSENEDEQAFHELIRSYTRLVVSIALRYRNYGLPLNDLIQEGNIGLLQAAIRFDHKRNIRFSTYAKWWIRSCVQEFVLRNWSIVRTGSTSAQRNLFFNLNRLRNQLLSLPKEVMSVQDQAVIAKHLHVTIQQVEEMEQRLSGHDLSLSNPISEYGEEDWQNLLSDTRPTPEESSFQEHTEQSRLYWIEGALNVLNSREKYIITKRRLSDSPPTLEELGKELSITKERVRQIEARALRRMRYYFMERMHEVRQSF